MHSIVIVYDELPLLEPAEDFAALRRSRAHMVVLDDALRITSIDARARELLDDVEPALPWRLPAAIEASVREWVRGASRGDFAATPIPGMLVRAARLGGAAGGIGVLIERVCSREQLHQAARRFGLSPRECDVLRLLLEGESSAEVAAALHIGEHTVGDYIKRLFAKTQVRNRSEMIAKCLGWRGRPAAIRRANCI
jgi:DNA-binding CsgD family transcriptional regulator